MNLYGSGSLDALDRNWGIQAAGAVITISFKFIEFDEIAKHLHKIRARFPNVQVGGERKRERGRDRKRKNKKLRETNTRRITDRRTGRGTERETDREERERGSKCGMLASRLASSPLAWGSKGKKIPRAGQTHTCGF